jgi:hypothetical protein
MAKGGDVMKIFLALSGVLVLAGCSSLPIQTAESSNDFVCDRAYMERVEQKAMEARVELRWVNCPLIRRDRAKSVS